GNDLPGAFSHATNWQADGMVLLPIAQVQLFLNAGIVALAMQSRLPVIYPNTPYVEDGGLMAFNFSMSEVLRRGAALADKILRGAHLGDLPFEQPRELSLWSTSRLRTVSV